MNELQHRATLTHTTLTGDNITTMQAYFSDEVVCLYANTAFAAWCGKFPQQIEGHSRLPELLGKQYRYMEQFVTDVLAGKSQCFELSRADPSGFGMRYVLFRLVPHVVFGKTKGFVVEANDITSSKQREEELRAGNEVVVKQKEGLLNFANLVTHNLLNYSSGLQATLELYKAAADEAEKEELFALIGEISANLSASLKTLGEVVRVPNMGRLPLERVNLHHYVLRAMQALSNQISATNAVVKNNVSQDIHVEAIPAYMESVVFNFLSNTIKYRHSERNPEIELSSIVVGNEAVLSIKDNGIGIDLDHHRGRLYGLYQTFSNHAEASGIGLFITKYQVDSMGGYIGVESEVGKGTEFRVYLKARD